MCEHHATTQGHAGFGFHLSAPLFLRLDLACICSHRWCILWSDRVLGSPHPPHTYFHDTALYTCTLRVWTRWCSREVQLSSREPPAAAVGIGSTSSKLFINWLQQLTALVDGSWSAFANLLVKAYLRRLPSAKRHDRHEGVCVFDGGRMMRKSVKGVSNFAHLLVHPLISREKDP